MNELSESMLKMALVRFPYASFVAFKPQLQETEQLWEELIESGEANAEQFGMLPVLKRALLIDDEASWQRFLTYVITLFGDALEPVIPKLAKWEVS